MASTERQVLKFIWENKGKASWMRIVRELRFFSPDYCRLICRNLIKNKLIELSAGQYKIANLGKKELEKLRIIEKAPKYSALFAKRAGQVEKAVKPKRPKEPKKPKTKIAAKEEVKEETKGTPPTELLDLTPELIEKLKREGFRTLEDIATASVVKLEGIGGLILGKAAKIINEAREKLKKEGKEYLWE